MSPRRSSEARTFLRFCTVGGLGFGVDIAVVTILTALFGMGPIPARLISMAAAITATWSIHRCFTFRTRDPGRLGEWGRFATVNVFGVTVNFATYWAVLAIAPGTLPLIALAPGCLLALAVNYLGSRIYAFRPVAAGRP